MFIEIFSKEREREIERSIFYIMKEGKKDRVNGKYK